MKRTAKRIASGELKEAPHVFVPVEVCKSIFSFLELKTALLCRRLSKAWVTLSFSWTSFNSSSFRATMHALFEAQRKSSKQERLNTAWAILDPFVSKVCSVTIPSLDFTLPEAYDFLVHCPFVTSLFVHCLWKAFKKVVTYNQNQITNLECQVSTYKDLKEILALHPALVDLRVTWHFESKIQLDGWTIFSLVPSLARLEHFSMSLSSALNTPWQGAKNEEHKCGNMDLCQIKSLELRDLVEQTSFSSLEGMDLDKLHWLLFSMFDWIHSPVLESLKIYLPRDKEITFETSFPVLPSLRKLTICDKKNYRYKDWDNILLACPKLQKLQFEGGIGDLFFCDAKDVQEVREAREKGDKGDTNFILLNHLQDTFTFVIEAHGGLKQTTLVAAYFLWKLDFTKWHLEVDVFKKCYTVKFQRQKQQHLQQQEVSFIRTWVDGKLQLFGSEKWKPVNETLVLTLIEQKNFFVMRLHGLA